MEDKSSGENRPQNETPPEVSRRPAPDRRAESPFANIAKAVTR